MNKDKVSIAVIIACLFGLLLIAIITPSEDEQIKVLEQRIELLKERCDDFQYTVNRVNALEATQQHQQEVLDTVDWAMKYRY